MKILLDKLYLSAVALTLSRKAVGNVIVVTLYVLKVA